MTVIRTLRILYKGYIFKHGRNLCTPVSANTKLRRRRSVFSLKMSIEVKVTLVIHKVNRSKHVQQKYPVETKFNFTCRGDKNVIKAEKIAGLNGSKRH